MSPKCFGSKVEKQWNATHRYFIEKIKCNHAMGIAKLTESKLWGLCELGPLMPPFLSPSWTPIDRLWWHLEPPRQTVRVFYKGTFDFLQLWGWLLDLVPGHISFWLNSVFTCTWTSTMFSLFLRLMPFFSLSANLTLIFAHIWFLPILP